MRFLIELFPAILPPLIYICWLGWARRKAALTGQPLTRFTDGPWVLTLLFTLLIIIGCFVWLGLSAKPTDGHYISPRLVDGKIVPGHIVP